MTKLPSRAMVGYAEGFTIWNRIAATMSSNPLGCLGGETPYSLEFADSMVDACVGSFPGAGSWRMVVLELSGCYSIGACQNYGPVLGSLV